MHEAVIVIAKYLIFVSVIVTAVFWIKMSSKTKVDFVAIAVTSGILALVLAYVGRKIYYDPRPFVDGNITPYFTHSPDNGFPSDHTLLASLLAFVVYIYSKRVGLALLLMAVLIGLARVVAGVHHLADIAGAIFISLLSVFIVAILYRRLRPVVIKTPQNSSKD